MSAGSLFPGGLGPAGVGGVLNETSPGAAAPLDSQLDFSFLDYAAQTNNASSTGGGLNQLIENLSLSTMAARDPIVPAPRRPLEAVGSGFGEPGKPSSAAENLPPQSWAAPSSADAEPPQDPACACSYCGISSPSSVVQCLATKRWFCNGRVNGETSCAVTHLVRARLKEVALHQSSPLGDATLECYATGLRNVFALGYVPLRSQNTVVLLSRYVQGSHPTLRDLDLDVRDWRPLIEERAFVPW
ncbi:UPF2 interacting domain of RNA helicase, partial [Helicosporidium sp. ATCC 50920]